MKTLQSALWKKLESFNINEENQLFTYEMKLARNNNWSVSHTMRVVEEYRRFLYLCFEAGHACSPSPTVDEAWHLHLTYTRSYWQRLCQEVLPSPLHHDPSTGGESETQKYEDWYQKTLESYERSFGIQPPTDIWPTTNQASQIPATPARSKRAVLLVPPLIGLLIVDCSNDAGAEWIGTLLLVGLFLLIIVAIALSEQGTGKRGDGGGCASTLGCASDSGHSGDSGGHGCGGHGCGGHGCGGGCGGGH
ncbi:hypothetical protein BH11ARM1_BH11ARM1_03320 [soil metagenome]